MVTPASAGLARTISSGVGTAEAVGMGVAVAAGGSNSITAVPGLGTPDSASRPTAATPTTPESTRNQAAIAARPRAPEARPVLTATGAVTAAGSKPVQRCPSTPGPIR